MNSEEIIRLRYRRQYLISPIEIECPYLHTKKNLIGPYLLYAHIDLSIAEYEINKTRLILLGDIFDYESPKKNNTEILSDLIDDDYDNFLSKLSKYAGRYIIIFIRNNDIYIVSDATALRKIYYHYSEKLCWCSSQPFLLAKVLNLKKTNNPSKLSFYDSDEYKLLGNANIGDTTIFDEIQQLIPNHYLDIQHSGIHRFWPNEKIILSPVNNAAELIAKMIKGYMESIGYRFKIMLPVTAGKDSRTLLAATRNIKNEVFYYLNKESNLNERSLDIIVPRKLLAKLGLKFNLVVPETFVDKDFEELYYSNFENASSKFLSIIYNYYINYSDKVNVPGVFAASVYDLYGHNDKNLTAKSLSKINWVQRFEYAEEYYGKWLIDSKDKCHQFGFNILALFYWEERIANWGTQTQQFKDISQEEYIPFNSRLLLKYCFSIEPKYLNSPNYILYKKIIKNLWPEALAMPFNPNLKHKIFKLLDLFGVLEILRKLKHKFTH